MSGGTMQVLQGLQDQGVLQGLSNTFAGIGQAGQGGLQNRGTAGGLASAFAGYGPGVLQGQEAGYARRQMAQQMAQQRAFSEAFPTGPVEPGAQISPQAAAMQGLVPEQYRSVIGAMGPEAGGRLIQHLMLAQMDPNKGVHDIGPGHRLVGSDGRVIAEMPASLKERIISTEAGTMMDENGQLRMLAPKAPDVKMFGDFAASIDPSTGKLTWQRPPNIGEDAIDISEGTKQNPLSSASAPGQFTNPTKLEFIQKHGVQVGQQLGDQTLVSLAQKLQGPASDDVKQQAYNHWNMHPEIGRAMTPIYKQTVVEPILKQALPGQEPNLVDYKFGYMLRGDAVPFIQAMRQNPDTPVSQLLSPDIIRSNPSVFGGGITVGQAYQRMAGTMQQAQIQAAARRNPFSFKGQELSEVAGPGGTKWYVDRRNAAGMEAPGSAGTSVSVGPDGTQVQMGGPSGTSGTMSNLLGGLGTGTAGAAPLTRQGGEKAETAAVEGMDQLAQLQKVAANFRPEFLQGISQAEYATGKLAMKYGMGGMLSDKAQKNIMEYNTFKQDVGKATIENIHRLAGANMTKQELDRISPTMPNMDDDPKTFAAKLQSWIGTLQSSIMRKAWLSSQGKQFSDKTSSIDVSDMPKFVLQQAKEKEAKLQAQGVAPDVAEEQTKAWLKQTFGLIPPPEYFRGDR